MFTSVIICTPVQYHRAQQHSKCLCVVYYGLAVVEYNSMKIEKGVIRSFPRVLW